jgi:hypothetical protein
VSVPGVVDTTLKCHCLIHSTMGKQDPSPNNPLSPYYPSETPRRSGDGWTWVAVVLVLMLLGSVAVAALPLVGIP